MSKLLVTRLPQETKEVVNPNTYNRLVRVLELNLGQFDPDNTRQINDAEKNKLGFNAGSLVWNTNNNSLEVYTGEYWLQVTAPTNDQGFQAKASVGLVDVKTNGNISVEATPTIYGWGIEQYYT